MFQSGMLIIIFVEKNLKVTQTVIDHTTMVRNTNWSGGKLNFRKIKFAKGAVNCLTKVRAYKSNRKQVVLH